MQHIVIIVITFHFVASNVIVVSGGNPGSDTWNWQNIDESV